MVGIKDIKENLWAIAILGGIFGAISIFTPAWGLISGGDFMVAWYWNLYYVSAGGGTFGWIDTEEMLFFLDLGALIVIAIATCILLLAGILDKVKNKKLYILNLLGGILLILGPTIVLAGAEAAYAGFFLAYNVNVAMILPFIGGALGILTGVMGIMEKRSE